MSINEGIMLISIRQKCNSILYIQMPLIQQHDMLIVSHRFTFGQWNEWINAVLNIVSFTKMIALLQTMK